MKVSGFTFIKNAVKFDYPVVEAISSILPLCDEMVVAAGNSDDNTRELITGINDPRIRIIDTVWDDSLREGGRVLAAETNKAFNAISKDADWCFYIQGDEVVHEKYHAAIKNALLAYKDDEKVEGLVFDYLHFYGSYDFVGDSRQWYRREVRIIKNDPAIRSFRDAQGFQKHGRPLHVKPANAYVYHYGWVKPPKQQQAKQQNFHKLWHDDNWINKNIPFTDEFDYSGISHLSPFKGDHPAVMQPRIKALNWKFLYNPASKNFGLKNNILHWVEKRTGWRIGEYQNYRII